MKKLLFAVSALIVVQLHVQAQEEETPSNDAPIKTLITPETRVGFNMAFDNFFTKVNGEQAYYTGVRGGFTFNRYLFVGLGGYGLVNNTQLKDWIFDGEDLLLDAGFAALVVEPILLPRQPVHITFPIMAGPGIALFKKSGSRYDWYDRDMFWAIHAGTQLELNVTRWLRLSGGAHYMTALDLVLPSTRKNFLDGMQYSFTLKIGAF